MYRPPGFGIHLSCFRWLTHTGRDVAPSGLKSRVGSVVQAFTSQDQRLAFVDSGKSSLRLLGR